MSSTCRPPGVFGSCLTRLSTGQILGTMVDIESGIVSTLAIMIFMGLIARNALRHCKDLPREEWSVLRTHVDVYFLCLLFFEFIHGISAIVGIKWVKDGEVVCGAVCTTQGAMRNIGSTGTAFVTLVIAIHTFAVIFFRWEPTKGLFMPIGVVSAIWACLIAYLCYQLIIPRASGASFYAPTPYWCWIGPDHTAERVWGQYLWIWLAAFISILLYVPLYFCVRGNLSYCRWKIRIAGISSPMTGCALSHNHAAKVATRDAMCMLYYPVAYVILVLPLSIVRFKSEKWQEEGKHFPFTPTVSASALFGLSGAVNVILFVTTRPNVLLCRSKPSCAKDAESPMLSEGSLTAPQQVEHSHMALGRADRAWAAAEWT